MINRQPRRIKLGACATVVVAALAGMPWGAFAQDCPTEQSGRRGFVVERGGQQKSNVFHDDNGIVRTVTRYNGAVVLETTQYEGLFQLDRLDHGRRARFEPQTDLKSLFPLKLGQTAKAKFTSDSEGRAGVLQVETKVTGKEDLTIGACKYSVLKIEQSESRNADPPRFAYIDYYSPMLKLILAKEYHDPGIEIIRYDRIYAMKRNLFIVGAGAKPHGRFRHRQPNE